MANEDNPFDEQKPDNAQGSRPSDSNFTSNLGDNAFGGGSQSQTATVPREASTVSARPDRDQQVDDLIKGGADAQRDTSSLTDSHPGVNMPLDKMNASQARSISDTQLQAQGVGGASQGSFMARNGNVETLTKSVENGQTRYYRPDGSYLEPVKHHDGSDRYEMRDSKNPTEVVRMKELPSATSSTPTDR